MADRSKGLAAALLGAAVLVGLCVPRGVWVRIPDLCLFHRATGLPCPTCGLTRSWSALLRGHPGEAFRHHLLGPALLAGLTAFLVLRFRGFRFGTGSRVLGWSLAGLWSAYALARMAGWLPSPR